MSRPGEEQEARSRVAYDAWHGALEVDAQAATPRHLMLRDVLEDDRDLAGRDVLEIGGGRGGFACWFATRGAPPRHLVAADFSPAAIARGRAHAAAPRVEGIEWAVHDIQRIDRATASFDTVISSETIEHVPDPAQALRELARVLGPGGRLFLTTPNYLGVTGLYSGWMRLTGPRNTEDGQPINNFVMLPRIAWWVRRAGLRLALVTAAWHYLLWPGRIPRRLLTLDRFGWLTRWAGLHSLIVAVKP
jgi:2-polyprenyl-3-methyl-5-hydroxy-6-metoxy-1,4-benzoquinol methylase